MEEDVNHYYQQLAIVLPLADRYEHAHLVYMMYVLHLYVNCTTMLTAVYVAVFIAILLTVRATAITVTAYVLHDFS